MSSACDRIVIIGGGLAGAATAWALARAGVRGALLIEAAPTPGTFSSGRSAGMVRRGIEDPALAPLARTGAEMIAQLGVPLRRTGSYLIDGPRRVPAAVRAGFTCRVLTPDEAAARVPLLADVDLPPVLETPDDGIVEVHALLEAYLAVFRATGGVVRCGQAVQAVEVERARVRGVTLASGEYVPCAHVVLATGAWGAALGRPWGLELRTTPLRRHVVCTAAPDRQVPWDWPWVWDLEAGFYFRPESSGLLWSPCDEHPDRPGAATAQPEAPTWLADKVARRLPRAAALAVHHVWAGHRTFAPDRRFVLGPDPRCEGWHWAVGLGGHGVTTSAAVGQCVADALLGRSPVPPALAVRAAVLRDARTDADADADVGDPAAHASTSGAPTVPGRTP